MITVRHNTDQLMEAVRRYQSASGRSMEEVIQSRLGNLAFFVRQELRTIAPAKGRIRQEGLARLASGGGVKVRDRIRDRYDSARERVRRELSARESARGFLSASARFPRKLAGGETTVSRGGQPLARATVAAGKTNPSGALTWPGISGMSQIAAEGLGKTAGESAIARAVEKTRVDMLAYIERKERQNLERSFRALGRGLLR